MTSKLAMAIIISSFSLAAHATITVSEPWARATVEGQSMGGAFLAITNDSNRDVALIGVATNVAHHAEMHIMQEANGMMQMVQVQQLDIPAHQTVTLAPKGKHIMLMGLEHALSAGQNVGLKLKFKDNGRIKRINVNAPVRSLGQ